MSSLDVKIDPRPIANLADALAATGKRLPAAQALVINRVVTRTRPKVVAAVAQKTGLYGKIISKAVRTLRASAKNPRAGLVSRGGEIGLRYFKAREEGSGVSADVAGDHLRVPGGFRRSGLTTRRMSPKLNKQVFINVEGGKFGGKIQKVGSGVFIPLQMIEGEAREAFEATVASELPAEIAKELAKVFPR